jgi:hypothetical protein
MRSTSGLLSAVSEGLPIFSLRYSSSALPVWVECHERQDLKEDLGTDMGRVRCRIVLWSYFDDISTDNIESGQSLQQGLHLARRQTTDLGRSGARRE